MVESVTNSGGSRKTSRKKFYAHNSLDLNDSQKSVFAALINDFRISFLSRL